MRRPSLFKHLRRRSFIPALILGYVLLFQATLGSAAASAHALAMAQQEALGLITLCAADGVVDRAEREDPQQAPAGDCLNCGIVCTQGGALALLPPPDPAPIYQIARVEALSQARPADRILPGSARFASDLPARAPPATL